MTPEEIETRWLSLGSWLYGCLLPVAVGVIMLVLLCIAAGLDGAPLDVTAAVLGSAGASVLAYNGIDILSARFVHARLLDRHERQYRAHLASVPEEFDQARDIFRLIDWIDRDLQA